jgi:transposase
MPKNGRMKMNDIKKILDLYLKACLGPRMIARALNKPKSTISDYINRFNRSDLKREDLDAMSAKEIYRSLFPAENPRPKKRCDRIAPDLNRMHLELKKKYVTRQLLWQEYREMYPDTHYGYTRFCNLYRDYQKRLNISMRINHKAGEKMFMDFSGLKWHIIDRESGEEKEVEIFVASLGASGYTFAEAAPDQTRASLISCAVHAFEFFGGVSEIIVLDNLKSAVTKADRYDPDINSSFQDMADHYDCVVIPARPYRAKDKAKVELSVKLVQRWILARLRHRQFFSLAELNQCIYNLLDDFNSRMIRRYGKSRHALYLELDKPALCQRALQSVPVAGT